MKRQQGFTLIELMIAVAIVAILAAIVFPSYEGQMRKSRRGTAQAFMMDVAQREQARFLDARSYATENTCPASGTASAAITSLGMQAPGELSASHDFCVQPVASPPGFRVLATAKGTQDAKNDEDLVLQSNGTKTRAGDAAKW